MGEDMKDRLVERIETILLECAEDDGSIYCGKTVAPQVIADAILAEIDKQLPKEKKFYLQRDTFERMEHFRSQGYNQAIKDMRGKLK